MKFCSFRLDADNVSRRIGSSHPYLPVELSGRRSGLREDVSEWNVKNEMISIWHTAAAGEAEEEAARPRDSSEHFDSVKCDSNGVSPAFKRGDCPPKLPEGDDGKGIDCVPRIGKGEPTAVEFQ